MIKLTHDMTGLATELNNNAMKSICKAHWKNDAERF